MSTIPELAVTVSPIGDHVLVIPIEKEQITASGIVIPDTANSEKTGQGVVVALGSGGIGKDQGNPHDYLKLGDTIIYGKYAGNDLKLKTKNGKEVEVNVMRLDSVLGVVS
ncbi:MAG: co-chaperone GroES [bacterium]|nr:co-chaperone GroES [bacterium]